MFICPKCLDIRDVSLRVMLFRSYGPCEDCGTYDRCADIASRNLPIPSEDVLKRLKERKEEC